MEQAMDQAMDQVVNPAMSDHEIREQIMRDRDMLDKFWNIPVYTEWTLDHMFEELAAQCAAIEFAERNVEKLVADMIAKQTTLFCEENGNFGRFTQLLDGLAKIKKARKLYEQVVDNLAYYTGINLSITYDKKTEKHTVLVNARNLIELENTKKSIAYLCEELAAGRMENFFTIIQRRAREKAQKTVRAKTVIAREKADTFIKWIENNLLHTPQQIEKLNEIIQQIIGE